jgi:hypothetical protein
MKKNKIYILLVLITVIVFFTTAALCNMCAAETEEKIGTEEETEENQEEEQESPEMSEEEESSEEEVEEEEDTEEEEEDEEGEEGAEYEEPTIQLEVYEGPLYSSGDDICYWRIRADVTGVPTPVVEFSKDDSSGAWGSRKAQVNIEDPSDSYTLTATATNSEGAASDSIVLGWECNRQPEISDIVMMGDHFVGIEYEVSVSAADPDGDTLEYSWSVTGGSLDNSSTNPVKWTMPDTAGDYQIEVEVNDGRGGSDSRTETVQVIPMLGPPIAAMEVPIVVIEGGKMRQDEATWVCNSYNVGDTNTNLGLRSYVSFDITGLSGATIENAELSVNCIATSGNCSSFCPLWVVSVNWEPGHIMPGDFNLTGDPIDNFSTASFSTDTDNLRIHLQNAIDSGRDRFQLMLLFTGMLSDNDSFPDYWAYSDSSVALNITYYP